MRKERYTDENNTPIGPDNGPMRMKAGEMGLSTAPSDTYANTCLGEINEGSNPHMIDRAQEEMPVRPCPGVSEDLLKGYVTRVSSSLRPSYKPYPKQK